MSGSSVVWFCRCDTMGPGDYCPKHGKVSEDLRLYRVRESEAFENIKKAAKELGGWKNLLDLVDGARSK